MNTRNINLSTSQSTIITESAALIPRLKSAIEILRKDIVLDLNDQLLTLVEQWDKEQDMSIQFGNYVVSQAAHYQGSATTPESDNIKEVLHQTDSQEFKKGLLNEFVAQAHMLKLAVEMITENPFNSQVFAMELPRGKMHTILQFDDEHSKNKDLVNALYYSTAALSEVAHYIIKTTHKLVI